MPKKSTPVRAGAQRSKPKTQKSFELVRSASPLEEAAFATQTDAEEAPLNDSTIMATTSSEELSTQAETPTLESTVPARSSRTNKVVTERSTGQMTEAHAPIAENSTTSATQEAAPKGSASARLAARRQSSQKVSQRSLNSLITTEHYAYVRKDLMFIAVLAITMFAILIILFLIPGLTL